MARKVQRVTIEGDPEKNRDAGKIFEITELPAAQAEKWAARAYLGMARTGLQVPDGVASLGIVGVFIVGMQALALMRFEELEPLMDEMMACVRIAPDPGNPSLVRNLVETDVEEVSTRLRLRQEVLELHAGFTLADGLSMLERRKSASATKT